MAPLTPEQVEERLGRLERELAEQRAAWAPLIAYLRARVRAIAQDRAAAERLCEELEGREGG